MNVSDVEEIPGQGLIPERLPGELLHRKMSGPSPLVDADGLWSFPSF